jgi:beta-glucosidase
MTNMSASAAKTKTGFPDGFAWGVASSAYQVEGGAAEDGKGASVWDMFCRKPGAIWGGQTGDVACDSYHHWRDDVRVMQDLGIKAYRFSISWARVMPQGAGAANPKGLDYYNNLVDGLLAAGIEPWVTLFHWDYPLALYHKGGWLNSDSPAWFADYAALVTRTLSDRVTHWMTYNEPQCFIGLGHQNGTYAPGDKLRFDEILLASHHALLGHGLSVQAMRANAKSALTIGIAPVGMTRMPFEETPANIEATRQAMFAITNKDAFSNTWWMDPIFLGHYPADGLALFGAAVPPIGADDFKTIAQPLDYLGVNIYNGVYTRAGRDGKAEAVPLPAGYPKTAYDYWPVTPEALYWGPRYFYERYQLPIAITENGHQNVDIVSLDGKVHDPQRIDYLHRFLRQLKRACTDGIPVKGYFQWSFSDNFEWIYGDASRNGIVFSDYVTQARIPKDSAYWYKQVIQTNGRDL